jgi:hypothetical protein
MILRCEQPSSASYRRYGARGVVVHPAWRGSFKAFLNDVGPAPSAAHTLDRIDGHRDYEPGNVRWATRAEQNRNMSVNHMLTLGGETRCITDWAKAVGVTPQAIRWRLRNGWPLDRALARGA